MKKILLILPISLLLATGAYAQNNGKYADLIVYKPNFDRYLAELHVADGSVRERLTVLRDQSGRKIRFASEAEALNYVAKQGWELVSSYHKSGDTHFIIRKTA